MVVTPPAPAPRRDSPPPPPPTADPEATRDLQQPGTPAPGPGVSFDGLTTALPRAEWRGDEVVAVARAAQRFDRVSTLGEGGMGRVELVRDNDIDRLVAVKRLKHGGDPRQVLRFAREARCLGQLEHPGIVPVHDVGRAEDGSYFLVMKHLEGETLETLIGRLRAGDPATHAAFPVHERMRICDAVLRVMEYAHRHGVIHRDLKPSNIMIGAHGEVTIVDWGLARQLDDPVLQDRAAAAAGVGAAPGAGADASAGDDATRAAQDDCGTQAAALLGTPLYMSPEQAAGDPERVGPASDVYSMAVVFYELLTLEHYLAGLDDLPAILDGVRRRVPPLAYWVRSPHQERVPIELGYWLRKALHKDPAVRLPSATAMRRELQRAADGRFDVVCPTTLTRRAFRLGMNAANRRPLLVLAALLGGVALAGYGALQALAGLL